VPGIGIDILPRIAQGPGASCAAKVRAELRRALAELALLVGEKLIHRA
jgi:hypothetical protein